MTSLAQLSLVPAFRRGHGALYDALAAGRIDEEALAALLTGTLPQLTDGDEGRAWAGEHDTIDYGLLEQALAAVPAADAARVREACAPWGRLRFAIDATPYPRPDAECSPERGHVHHDACRCDSTRKTIPGWEYQFTAALGHLRTAWAALIDVERTTPAIRTQQTARQVKNLLRRLPAAGHGDRGAPLVIMDAGYSAAALTAALRGHPVHLLIRLASGTVFYADPITWPGKKGRPGKHGMPVTCHSNPGQANPEPDETLMLPDTPRYGTVRVSAWRAVHPLIHGDRGYFAGWDGDLPVLRGTVLRVIVARLPDGRAPHKTMWLWHAGPAPLSLDELWRAYLARFDEEHAFKFAKSTLGLTAAKVRTPQQADRWVRLVMAAVAQLLIARPHAARPSHLLCFDYQEQQLKDAVLSGCRECAGARGEVSVRQAGLCVRLVRWWLPAFLGAGGHLDELNEHGEDLAGVRAGRFTSTEVVYGVTGTDVTVLPEYGVSP